MSKQRRYLACLLALAIFCCVGVGPLVARVNASLSPAGQVTPGDAAQDGGSVLAPGGDLATSGSLAGGMIGSLQPESSPSAGGNPGTDTGGESVASLSPSAAPEDSPLTGAPGGGGNQAGSLAPETGSSLAPETGSSGQDEGSLTPETGGAGGAEEEGSGGLSPEAEEGEGTASPSASPSPLADGISPMSVPWSLDSIIVETYAEFATILSGDNGYNTIYLGADISGDYSSAPSILIHANKRNVVIDGQDPRPGGQRHSYTSRRSAADTGSIYLRSANIQSVTFQNIDIVGLAYYGICQINDSSSYAANNFKVTVKNATYTGPQMFWGADAILRLEDFTYTSSVSSGVGALNEVAEMRALELAGRVKINHNVTDKGLTALWFRYGSTGGSVERYIRVEQGAQVDFVTDSYFIARDGGVTINVTVETGGRLDIIATRGHRDNGETLQNITVKDRGRLSFSKSASNGYYGLRIAGALSVGDGSTFILKAPGSVPALYLGSSAASVTFNNPAFAQIYNPSGALMGFSSDSRPLSISADTVNMWQNSASAVDSINNMPTAIWNKTDTATPVTISLSYSSSGAPSGIVSSNLSTSDPVIEGVAANMNMSTARQITMGKFTLNGPIMTSGASGNTEPNADMRMTYGSPATVVNGTADAAGVYALEPPGGGTIALNEEVIVLSHRGMLKARNRKAAELDPTRTVRFEQVPAVLSFGTATIQPLTQTVPRVDPAWSIQIYDGRGAGSTWKVQASIIGPLTSGGGDTLPNALVYVNGGVSTPFSATEQLIYSGTTAGNHSSPAAYTDISWPATEGPLLQIGPGQGSLGETYSTTIVWALYDTP